MAIEIKESRILFIGDPNRKEAPYHICNRKLSFVEIIRYQLRETLPDVSFSWRVMSIFSNFLLPDISNCPFCGIDLEKEYQAKINPPKQEQHTDIIEFGYGC